MKDLVCIKIVPSRIEAEIIVGKLTAYGIKAVIIGGDAGGVYPFPMQPTPGVEIYVHKKDVHRAHRLIRIN